MKPGRTPSPYLHNLTADRGFTTPRLAHLLDDVAESTGMSEETARVSFHQIAAEVAYGELGRLHLDTLSDDELTVTLKEFEEV